jgi:protein SCO1/2
VIFVIRAVQRNSWLAAAILGAGMFVSRAAFAQGMAGDAYKPATPPPQILSSIGIDQNLNAQLPLDLPFTDENGKSVKLGDYFGQKPVVLALVYYDCPMMCTEVLNGMVTTFGLLKFDIGKEYDVVTVSFDPRETPKLARQKKDVYLRRYGRPGGERGWHFLTGQQPAIDALTKAAGFHYQWDNQTQQFAHATAIMVVTPEGKLAQYFYGIEYSAKDLRLGLIEASARRIGTVVDTLLLYCYHYDPRTGRYGAIVSRVLQIAGGITVVLLGGFLIAMFKLEPKRDSGRGARVGGR